ncbi:hypothetical protein ABE61_09650 [Lysinibacillus sphaericus]|uniref:hypothetical protein n=1 Tax=Lysinibacillus sphaericus TaxID=1421 RepID=UPI0018CD6601|nr:hypothetical protein [Lysinibacillus sphaericus]MBG9454316.1 hypothetical protein [Lysinibacillus sphaericus]MBG9476448.1 hypothetical protein [Lysinibacillus sphaericus]MBG9591234.1 hypothetical protein [Lysinibacillus sphaericus]
MKASLYRVGKTINLNYLWIFLLSEGLISVPAERFVAAASLTLRFRTEQSFLGASDEPLHSLCSLQGLGPTDVFCVKA